MKKSKAQKHEEALIRQKKYDSLSTEEKLFQIEMRQGESKKEANRILKPTSTDTLRNDTGFEMMKDEEKEGWDKHNAKLTTKTPKYREVQANWDKEMRERGQDGDKHTDWRKSLSKSKKEQSKAKDQPDSHINEVRDARRMMEQEWKEEQQQEDWDNAH